MLRLTLELSGASMRRTPTVAVEATGACASLLTGLLPPVLEAHAADGGLHGGQFGRRQYIGHGRNRAGQPAVCRHLLRNGAFRHHPHLNAFSLLCVNRTNQEDILARIIRLVFHCCLGEANR